MANFTRQRASGLWVPGSVVLQDEFEGIDEIRPKLINASDGSTHAPSTQIVLGGSGLRVSGPSRLDSITLGALAATGTFTVSDNSRLIVDGGAVGGLIQVATGAVPGRIDLDGANAELRVKSGTFIIVKSGGLISIEAGGALDSRGAATWYSGASNTIQTGVTWTFNAGSTISSNGDFFFASSTWPKLSPARNWERHSLTIAVCSGTTTTTSTPNGSTTADSWKVARASVADQIFAAGTLSSADFTLIEFVDLPQGGTVVSATIDSIGATAATVTMTFPVYQFIRWDGSAVTTMSALTNDAHVIANWTTQLSTTITITSNAAVDKRYRYGLVVHHCFGASIAEGDTYYVDCRANGTAVTIEL